MNWRTSGILRFGELLRRALGDDLAARRHQVGVVADLEALGDVVRDEDRGRAGGVVEGADEVGGDRHRDRVEAGERLVVHDQLGVERDRARERDAPCHAAGDLGDAQRRCAAQADRVQLHQDDVADHRLVEVGVLAQREGDVLEDREIGEQGAELEQHAEPASQREQLLGVVRVDDLALDADRPLIGRVDAADQAQQRRLAAARAAEDGGDLAAAEGERDVVEDGPARVVAEDDVIDLDEQVGVGTAGGFGGTVDVGHQAQRGSSLEPMSIASTARAAWRPSRIAQTTSDWPRRTSPAANTLATLVA